jgi:hypothetical protein
MLQSSEFRCKFQWWQFFCIAHSRGICVTVTCHNSFMSFIQLSVAEEDYLVIDSCEITAPVLSYYEKCECML